MSKIIKRSEFPKVSADPLQQIVDYGFPLHKYKNGSRHVKLFQESQVLPRTNDFRPTPTPYKKHFREIWTDITNAVTDLKEMSRDDFVDILIQDMHDEREFEVYDPLKGNSLAITDYLNDFELYIFAAGPSLSHLVILSSKKSSYDFGLYQTELALDQMEIVETIDLKYPIRQVQLSPLSTSSDIIFLIRTTSSIHLIKYDGALSLVHKFILPEQSLIYTDINYSMPIHVEPSPYHKYQYTFTTNNGYTALIDGSNDRILFENLDSIPEHVNYSSRWRSCGFGKTPTTIYTASPECIKEYTVRDKEIQTKILAAPNDRIVAFKTSDQFLYCFSTLDVMVVMDRLLPERPVVTWLHKMRDGPPTEIIFHPLPNNNWRIIGFSSHTQRITMMHFHYVNNPVKVKAPEVQVLEMHNFHLSPLKFEEIYKTPSRIHAAGFNVKTNMKGDLTKGSVLFSVTRLFDDGSIRLQYIELNNEKNSSRLLPPLPKYELLTSCQLFEDILLEVENAILPECKADNRKRNEVFNVNPINFVKYLQDTAETGANKLTDEIKREIADKVRYLKSTTTFLQLFDKDVPYSNYTLQELTDFLEEMEVLEEIERARQIDIPGVFHLSQPKNTSLREKLKSAHEKKIQLSSLMIRPLKDTTDKFQYLSSDQFHSTTTTKALAELWTIDDTRFDRLTFPQYQSTERLLPNEIFPCVSIYKRQREEDDDSTTAIDKSTIELPEIPMPVVAASAPPAKKKLKMNNTANSITPIVLSDDEEDNITTRSLALSLLNTQPSSSVPTASSSSPSLKYAATSTQPLPGAFASRTKKPTAVKKKKKPKTSGFK